MNNPMRQLKITNKITNRESLSLEKYLQDISKIPMLVGDDEIKLAQRIRENDEEALNQLIRSNLRFVVSVSKQYQNQGLSLSDLINEGNVGLMKAAKRFDETKGFKFISYAVWWIRQSILQAIVDHSRIVRLPLNKVGTYNKINEAVLNFIQKYEREPSTDELAAILDISPKDVLNMQRSNARHISMDAPIGQEDSELTMLETMPNSSENEPDKNLMAQSMKEDLKEGLSILSEKEVEVLSSYYGLDGQKPLTLEEIGEYLQLTRERVRQIKERAIRRLRKSYNRNALKSYL
jgi:RNA polymerase primary sigma factor